MRIILILFTLFFYGSLTAQDSTTKYFFKEVGWTINLSSDFKIIDSTEDAVLTDRGKKAIEEATDVKVDASETITLILAKKNAKNYFNAALTPFNPKKDGDYKIVNQSLKDITYNTMSQYIIGGKIDSFSTKMNIAGLTFDKFTISIKVNELVLFDMVMVSKLYKEYDFGITYFYSDKKTKKQIEDMLSNSTFTK